VARRPVPRLLVAVLLTAGAAVLGAWAAPDPVTKVTAASGDGQVTLEWVNPGSPDFQGVLVLRNTSSGSSDTPTDGTSYGVGDTVGSSDVVCKTTTAETSCTDATVSNGGDYYFTLFAFDSVPDYSTGVEVRGLPRDGTTYKWTFTTGASALNPAGVIGAESVVAIGADEHLHRMAELDGTRGDWEPPVVGGAVQSRPMVLDLDPGGTRDDTAFVTAQDGYLYRFSVDGDGTAEASTDIAGSSSCPGAILQAAPVVMLDYYDGNMNDSDDVVVVATRNCDRDGDGTAHENRVVVLSHDLNPVAGYDGDETSGGTGDATLGDSNGAPRILYRNEANNLVYIPFRQDGDDGESLVVIEILSGPGVPSQPYSEVAGIGDIDATPIVFRLAFTDNFFLVLGDRTGEVYLYDAVARENGDPAPAPLELIDTEIHTGDGAVKGLAVSTPVPQGGGLYRHWVAWSTDTTVHGVAVKGGTVEFENGTYWAADIADPSPPLVLRGVPGQPSTLVYVGSSDGKLYELDATDGTVNRSWQVETGATIGSPTFDYNSGSNQGIVVGSTSGLVHWIAID
jgi:hypothetical protein